MRTLATAAFAILLSVSLSVAGTAGLAWDESEYAEGYRVYYRAPSGSFNASDLVWLPVCGGYYDDGTLVEGDTCVARTAPAATVTLPDTPPVLILAVKSVNEIGESAEYSNEVRKHNQPGNAPGNARRTDAPPAPSP